ncbi:MAG: fatty acid desaturase [Phenylobacterium sp.]|uniref:fatty acid desaturase n=1 Tax=Phenylobacterium sp. TaxID=1871053 RepID=UPI001A3FBD79|nr:fatty acid desaturase [Phenylobacterium sp.]MBL8772992.1 fatty acid desaturase [Phenylobacterium sp.]
MTDPDPPSLRTALAPFQRPDTARALAELAYTLVPLLALWGAIYLCVARGWWLGLALTPLAAIFLVRLFMIQHDCGHQAFLPGSRANAWIGRLIGVLTMTPYDYWRRTHAIHHATSADLDRRGLGAIETLTVGEYRALGPIRRLGYRLYRHPLVMLGFGPPYMFLLQHRLPIGVMREGWAWRSVLGNNLGLLLLAAALIPVVGLEAMLLAHLPVVAFAAAIGVALFYVQHQFEGVRWKRHDTWEPAAAAIEGSSHLVLPQPLRWLTANIGAHHVHHASSRIPFYRLPEALDSHAALAGARRLRGRDLLPALRLALWDEAAGRLVTFREARPG